MTKKAVLLAAIIAAVISFAACTAPLSKLEKETDTLTEQPYGTEESETVSETETETESQTGEETATVFDGSDTMPDLTEQTSRKNESGNPYNVVEPVSTESRTIITEPAPNCFSIFSIAASRAFFFSSAVPGLSRFFLGAAVFAIVISFLYTGMDPLRACIPTSHIISPICPVCNTYI